MPIILPTEIVTSDKTPRFAMAFDRSSGSKRQRDTGRRVLLVGQQLAASTQAVHSPVDLFRESDSEVFGAGSVLDVGAKAAFRANRNVKLTAVSVADPTGVKASGTVTFATNLDYDAIGQITIGDQQITWESVAGDTPTTIAAAAAAAINAVANLPVTAASASGVLTVTAKSKGTIGNGIAFRFTWSRSVATTATLSPSTGVLGSGTGTAAITSALAAVAAKRYHVVAVLLDDSTSGAAAQEHVELVGDAEHGFGEIAVQVVNGSMSTATTLAAALNGVRNITYAINGSDSWMPAIAGAVAAVMSGEEHPARPYNTLELGGIKPPPVEKRWIRSELRSMLDNGVAPLVVQTGEKVGICRAICTYFTDSNSNPDYSILDVNTIQCFDAVRDQLALLFGSSTYRRALFADDDPESVLPPEVITPNKARLDVLDELRALERQGIVQHVEALQTEMVFEKVGKNLVFSLPTNFVDGLQAVLGRSILVQTA